MADSVAIDCVERHAGSGRRRLERVPPQGVPQAQHEMGGAVAALQDQGILELRQTPADLGRYRRAMVACAAIKHSHMWPPSHYKHWFWIEAPNLAALKRPLPGVCSWPTVVEARPILLEPKRKRPGMSS